MAILLQRVFEVALPLERTWDHLARVTDWPTWAAHIERIDLSPDAPLGPNSSGTIVLTNGIRSTFRMTEFDRPNHWKWSGPFLWLTVDYDHRFETVSADRTRLIWTVDVRGIGTQTLGRLFASIYRRNLDRAIPRLVEEMNTLGGR